MAEDKFRLPGSSYEELTKIIKSYGQFTSPTSLDEVSKFIGMDKTIISRNSGFLIEIGILEPGKKKVLTIQGKELAQALEHDMSEEIINGWREIANESNFCTKLISAIKIRNGMDESTLQSHIAYSAGQPKKPQFMTGAKTVIDILQASELIRELDGKYIIVPADNSPESLIQERKQTDNNIVNVPANIPIPSSIQNLQHPATEIAININISVECSIDKLDELGDKLKEVIRQVQSKESAPKKTHKDS